MCGTDRVRKVSIIICLCWSNFRVFFFLDNQFNKWNHRFDVNGPIRLFAVLTYSCSLKSNVYMHHITGYIRTHAHEIKNTLQFYISHAEVQLVECAVICCCCCWLISFVFFLRYTKLQLCSFYIHAFDTIMVRFPFSLQNKINNTEIR